MGELKLYMVLLGCKPPGRHTEQHDVFFGIGPSLRSLVPAMVDFWPEAKGKIHLDAYRQVTLVDGWQISVGERTATPSFHPENLFFINLGGYKEHEMEEFHYKLLAIGKDKNEAMLKAKSTAFFKHTGFTGATSHIDDKYGVDVDDLALVQDILPPALKYEYALTLTPASPEAQPDPLYLGYFKLEDVSAGKHD